MRQRRADTKLVHHTFQGNDGGAVVTSLVFFMDGLVTGSEALTVNPAFPRAAKLVGVFANAACLVVNSAGDWTLRLRDGATDTDLATMTMPVPALPSAKTVGQMSSQVVLQAGQTYYMFADGPSRNFTVARLTLEWEVL